MEVTPGLLGAQTYLTRGILGPKQIFTCHGNIVKVLEDLSPAAESNTDMIRRSNLSQPVFLAQSTILQVEIYITQVLLVTDE